jgi:flagellar hook protein FlgE
MQAAQHLMAVHAHNIANVNTEGLQTDPVDDVVGLVVASHTYSANAKVFAVMAETERSLLDVRG